jgi:hypothetical protein
MTAKKKSLIFIIICCLLLPSGLLVSPASAGNTGATLITAKLSLTAFDIAATTVGQSLATITWKTNGNANSTIEYGLTTGYGSIQTNPFMETNHTITLSGLAPGTLYHWRVMSSDQGGNRYVSTDYTFRTLPTTPVVPETHVYGGGGDGGSGGGPEPGAPQVLEQPAPPEQPQHPEQPGPPEQVEIQNAEVTENYPIGFVGLVYNADDQKTLELDLDKAAAAGATVTLYSDHIDVYQHGSPGMHLTFWGDNFTVTNHRIVKQVKSAELTTDPLVATLSIGTVSGSIHAVSTRILHPATIRNTISDNLTAGIIDLFHAAADQHNLTIESVAYTFEVTRINLSKAETANISVSLPARWVNQHGGKDSIYIARIDEETTISELLNTIYTGFDDKGNMVFRGDSPNGTSFFGVLSVLTPGMELQRPSAEHQLPQNPVVMMGMEIYSGIATIVRGHPIEFVIAIMVIAVIFVAYVGFVFYVWDVKPRTAKRR